MMNCSEVTRVAGDFLGRRLRLRQRIGVLMHIAMCRGCRRERAQSQQRQSELLDVSAAAGAREHRDDLLQHFRQRKGRE